MRTSTVLFTRANLAAFGLGAALSTSACSSPPPAETPPASEPTPSAEASTPEEPAPELSDEAAALIAETEGAPATAPAGSSTKPTTDSGKGYEFVYRVKPNELRIEVLTAAFQPTVKAVRVRGGWGVEVSLEGTATSAVSLAADESGPMAFAATVHRPAEEKSGDKRGTTKDVTLGDKAQSWKRTWPGPDEKPLASGQELLLQVGLWGIGPSPAERKLAKKFFEVKLTVDKQGGLATVAPPK
ncbi:MAG TPA: hypothetical protein VLC09_04280 [Polyangiaceae bacterium]|nr:hypothetical protein [Polyangiaceae bacterium]